VKSELHELSKMFVLAAFKTGIEGISFTGSATVKDKSLKIMYLACFYHYFKNFHFPIVAY